MFDINNIKTYIKDLLTIRSTRLFGQTREFYFRVFKKQYKRYGFLIDPRPQSDLYVDVIIPVVEKDVDVLAYAIQGIRKHLKHKNNVYIVAPLSEAIKKVAEANGAIYLDEKEVCSITKDDISFTVNGNDRSGWLYQQILKYSFGNIGQGSHFLVLDSDTFFIKDIIFEKNGKFYFDFSDEFHVPYYKSYERLTGLKHSSTISFITHYMLFDKNRLAQLKLHIQQHTGHDIIEAIKSLIGTSESQSIFSEYETYANFCIHNWPSEYSIRYWFNESYSRKQLHMAAQIKTIDNNTKSISFHSHNTK